MFSVRILSDVHGNVEALRAVLNDPAAPACDETVVAGDLVLFGPRPVEALALVRALAAPTIAGNTDRDVVQAPDAPGVAWARAAIAGDGVAYLAGLPFDHRISPPGGRSPADDLLIVHATPADVNGVLTVEPDAFGERSLTPTAEAERLLAGAQAALIVSGHVHYASEGVAAGRRFASIGAVGFPFDGDPRAAYAIAWWDGGRWGLEHRRAVYDHEAVAAEVAACGAPFAAQSARRLRTARKG